MRGVTDDNLNPLTCQPNPIGRLGEQKYGIRNTENMESEGGKYVNVAGAKAQIVPSRLPLVKLNKVKVDQVRLTQIRKGEKVMELTSSSSREHFI